MKSANFAKILFIVIFSTAVLFWSGSNFLDKLHTVGWHYSSGEYAHFANLKSVPQIHFTVISFLQDNLDLESSCALWEDSQYRTSEIVLETLISNIYYHLYPLKVYDEEGKMNSRPDYILCEKWNYETLNLFMVFFDFDMDYVKLAENSKWIILKKKITKLKNLKINKLAQQERD